MKFIELKVVCATSIRYFERHIIVPLLCGSNQLTSSPLQTIINPRDVRDQTLRATACQFRECR